MKESSGLRVTSLTDMERGNGNSEEDMRAAGGSRGRRNKEDSKT